MDSNDSFSSGLNMIVEPGQDLSSYPPIGPGSAGAGMSLDHPGSMVGPPRYDPITGQPSGMYPDPRTCKCC